MDRKKFSLIVAALCCCGVFLMAQENENRSSHATFTHTLPSMEGSRLRAELVEVTYGPGGASPVHSHSCPVIGYVLEGAIRMQVKGQPESTFKQGESFYEAPNGVHLVSANLNAHKPAKFLAIFVCDKENAQ